MVLRIANGRARSNLKPKVFIGIVPILANKMPTKILSKMRHARMPNPRMNNNNNEKEKKKNCYTLVYINIARVVALVNTHPISSSALSRKTHYITKCMYTDIVHRRLKGRNHTADVVGAWYQTICLMKTPPKYALEQMGYIMMSKSEQTCLDCMFELVFQPGVIFVYV